jgi:hypothetical protein
VRESSPLQPLVPRRTPRRRQVCSSMCSLRSYNSSAEKEASPHQPGNLAVTPFSQVQSSQIGPGVVGLIPRDTQVSWAPPGPRPGGPSMSFRGKRSPYPEIPSAAAAFASRLFFVLAQSGMSLADSSSIAHLTGLRARPLRHDDVRFLGAGYGVYLAPSWQDQRCFPRFPSRSDAARIHSTEAVAFWCSASRHATLARPRFFAATYERSRSASTTSASDRTRVSRLEKTTFSAAT